MHVCFNGFVFVSIVLCSIVCVCVHVYVTHPVCVVQVLLWRYSWTI